TTRALRTRQPDLAIERAAAAARDWSGGTRIGEALQRFNDGYGRRGLARGAVVVILSDGWECGDPALVEREMGRLRLIAHRIVWVNPRKASREFAPLSGGMAAALPSCDEFLSGHSLRALEAVTEAIAVGRRHRRRYRSSSRMPSPWMRRWARSGARCSTSSESRTACPERREPNGSATTRTRSRSRSRWGRCR